MLKKLQTPSSDYPIVVDIEWLNADSKPIFSSLFSGRQVMLVSDDNVAPLYLNEFSNLLASFEPSEIQSAVIPNGEDTKSMPHFTALLETLCNKRFDRTCILVALGGGVVGDLVGFVASVYQRGVDYVQCPTTLLAQVDSSVGGKTAINFLNLKNVVGTFYHPKAVFIAIKTLKTLSDRDYFSGYAEVIKYAMISAPHRLDSFMQNIEQLKKKSDDHLLDVVSFSIDSKAKLVAQDEFERSSARQFLNFGHTFGHVIESFYHFKRYTHGESVAIGMMMATWISRQINPKNITPQVLKKLALLLKALNLPTRLDEKIPLESVKKLLSFDKKIKYGVLNMIGLDAVGDPYVLKGVSHKLIENVISLEHYEEQV